MKTNIGYCKKLSNEQCAYLAGLIDGEGCIAKKGNGACIEIAQDMIRSMDFIIDWIGYGKIYKNTKKNTTHIYGIYALSHSGTVQQLLEQILPYLVWKKEKAIQAIEIVKKVDGYKKQ